MKDKKYIEFCKNAKSYTKERLMIVDNKFVKGYICNYGIPDSYIFNQMKNIIFSSKKEAITHAYNIYKLVREDGNDR